MKKIVALVAALFMALAMAGTAQAAPKQPNVDCNGVLRAADYPDGVKNVTVNEGASCTLSEGLVVSGGVHAKPGAVDLLVYTEVGRNIQALGVTGTVHVGPESCKYDPPIRNNVMVKKSHNVLICWVWSGNNIVVTGNDGQVTVRDSHADNNIMVNRNKKYVADGPVAHRKPGAIRVLRNEYGNHLFTKGNHKSRVLIVKGNHKV